MTIQETTPETATDDVHDSADVGTASGSEGAETVRRKGSVSISVRTLTVGAVITVLTVAVVVLGWLYFDARHQVLSLIHI